MAGLFSSAKGREDRKYIFSRVYALARQSGMEHHDAEDCAATAVEKALKSQHLFSASSEESLCSWAIKIGRNVILDGHRRRRLQRNVDDALELEGVHTPVGGSNTRTRNEAAALRGRVVAKLSDDDQAVLRMWVAQWDDDDNMTAREAALLLELSVPAYEAAKKRVKRNLTKALDDLGLTNDDIFDDEPQTVHIFKKAGRTGDQ